MIKYTVRPSYGLRENGTSVDVEDENLLAALYKAIDASPVDECIIYRTITEDTK